MNSNPRIRSDVEDGGAPLTQTMSSPIDQQRSADFNHGVDDFGGTKKAGTFPAGPPGDIPTRAREASEPMNSPNEKDEHGLGSNDSGSATLTSDPHQNGAVDRSVGPESGPRKRKMRKFIPFMSKKDDADEQDLQRADTSESRKKKHPKLTIGSQFKAVFASWINLMLVFVPVGIALHEVKSVDRVVVFIINFLAIIPLAAMLSFATEELALYVGETLGGLLNASFGNAVELIVSIIALAQKKIVIVQTSLVSPPLQSPSVSYFLTSARLDQCCQTCYSSLACASSSVVFEDPSSTSTLRWHKLHPHFWPLPLAV
jgi:Ca2+:H+ antiporter